jgi:hypothetical protein
MYFEFADRQFWDTLIFIVFGLGAAAAAFRIYQDFSRPLPPGPGEQINRESDTKPHKPNKKKGK